MLTQARANVLTEILSADEARTQTLLSLEPHEAVKQINALGNDFTVDELCEYGQALQAAKGELDAEALDDVAGGGGWADFAIGVAACVAWDTAKWVGSRAIKLFK